MFPRSRAALISAAVFSLVAGGVMITTTGCGDVVTYYKYSRQQGIDALNSGNLDVATGAFRDAIRQNPTDYQSAYYLATIYAKQGRYTEAAAQYKTAMAVQQATYDGRHDGAFHIKMIKGYADAVAKINDHDATVNQLEQDAKGSNTGDEAYTLALVYAGRGDADSAIPAFARAAEQAPGNFDIAKDQGLFLTRVGQKAQAEQALRRAYRLNQSDNEVNDALRSLGVIPGPSLLNQDQVAKPLIPVGPIPNYIDRLKTGSSGSGTPGSSTPATPPAPAD